MIKRDLNLVDVILAYGLIFPKLSQGENDFDDLRIVQWTSWTNYFFLFVFLFSKILSFFQIQMNKIKFNP